MMCKLLYIIQIIYGSLVVINNRCAIRCYISRIHFLSFVNLDIALFAAKQKENSSIYMILNILKSIKYKAY